MGTHEKIYLIEDDIETAREAYQELTNAGHTVVWHSSNYPNAIVQIPVAIAAGMTVAVVDGNLEYYREDCQDGREIAESIREQAPGTTIVAFSRSPEKNANFGDIYVRKSSKELAEKFFETAFQAREVMESKDLEVKRELVRTVGWNLFLKDKKLQFSFKKPYDVLLQPSFRSDVQGRRDSNPQESLWRRPV